MALPGGTVAALQEMGNTTKKFTSPNPG
jgi:hypothetical protein